MSLKAIFVLTCDRVDSMYSGPLWMVSRESFTATLESAQLTRSIQAGEISTFFSSHQFLRVSKIGVGRSPAGLGVDIDGLAIPITFLIFVGDALFAGGSDYPAERWVVSRVNVIALNCHRRYVRNEACLPPLQEVLRSNSRGRGSDRGLQDLRSRAARRIGYFLGSRWTA
jgi:hypothetical protein